MSKSARIDIRTSEKVKSLLQQAAEATNKNVSEFLLESGLLAAEKTLADRSLFALDDKKWKEFQAALDRNPQDKSRLKELLNQPSIFD